jgi:cytochrome c biogenesis protein CcmG/thiol:disulfide interchange protein DsbE
MERKKLILFLPLIALFIISSISAFALYKNSKKQSFDIKLSSKEKVLLQEFSFQDLYNKNSNLTNNDLDGQYSLISVFASWCITCKSQHKILMEISDRNYLDIYGVAWRDIDKSTLKYLENNGNPYKKVGIDGKGILSKILSVKGVPESFLVNQNGEVIYKHQGVIDGKFLNIIKNLPSISK